MLLDLRQTLVSHNSNVFLIKFYKKCPQNQRLSVKISIILFVIVVNLKIVVRYKHEISMIKSNQTKKMVLLVVTVSSL